MQANANSIPGRFAQIAADHADRIAVSAPGGEWTYAELDRRSSFVAADILSRLGQTSEPVALLMEHDAPLIAAILGTLKADKIYLVLDASHPAEQLAAMLASSGSKLLLADKTNLALANSFASGHLEVFAVAENLPGNLPRANFAGIAGGIMSTAAGLAATMIVAGLIVRRSWSFTNHKVLARQPNRKLARRNFRITP